MLHGRIDEAERVIAAIECETVTDERGMAALPRLRLRPRRGGFVALARSLFRLHPRRSALGTALMSAQAFFYNAIFFTYALVLGEFFDIPAGRVGLYLIPFAAGNFLGPLVLGRWFDTLGRRPMIASTYALSGLLLLASAWLFASGWLDATTMTIAWSIVFFFASAAASAAYLTVGESFPLEVRALAIAVFYALGTAIGGIAGPWLFGALIGTGHASKIAAGYAFGASLMLAAAVIELWLGVPAERKSLEDIAAPLSRAD
jgi:MFS family permease